MKRFLFCLLLLISSSLLSAALQFPQDIVDVDRALLEEAFKEAVGNRKEVDIVITSYVPGAEGEDMQLSFLVEGRSYNIRARDEAMLASFLADALYAEQAFLDSAQPHIESIYHGFIVSSTGLEPGRLYKAFGEDGRVSALLMADQEDRMLYPRYQKDLLPGMRLEEGPRFAFDISVFSPISKPTIGALLNLRYISLWSFIEPRLALGYIYENGEGVLYSSLGLETNVSLAGIFETSFTFLEDASLYASLEAVFGLKNSVFFPSVTYSIGYEHRATSLFYWRIGYQHIYQIGNSLSLAGGFYL